MLDLNSFISRVVTKRKNSLFQEEIDKHSELLSKEISGSRVLVIGGAGSIGSSFIKEVLAFHPAGIVIVDVNENGLAELTRDIRSTGNLDIPKEYVTYPMDYASQVFCKMFRSHGGFDIVANFSAHKHVRSEKDIYSVEAMLENNIFHAQKLLSLLSEYPPKAYFCVSTDKAANPANIMGASKRIMEDLVFSYSDTFPVKTARFANVAFSNGSLPDGFLERMQKLQPVSAPVGLKRYFVSPKESGQICMLACVAGNNREIFFPKLKETQMMSFDVIATELLHEAGYEVLQCKSDEEACKMAESLKKGSNQYPVHFSVPDTSGEKPFEEFYTLSETIDLERYSTLGVITGKEKPDREKVQGLIVQLEEALNSKDASKEDVISIIEEYLPEFKHIETGKSLDSKM